MGLIIVLNCGSSSIKFQLIDSQSEKAELKGLAENLGTERSRLKWQGDKKAIGPNHQDALEAIAKLIEGKRILAIGHRVVHGGERFRESVLITPEVMSHLHACSDLAPLHNPVNILGVQKMQELFPELPQVAVFDTAFHQTLPEMAFLYALPYDLYKTHHVRKYGFHGTSHRYVIEEAAKELGKKLEETRFISCHLGNGSSAAACLGGKSIDTSMGMTPLEGLMMGERAGDLDPSLVPFLGEKLRMTGEEVVGLLNKESGLKGVSGISEDMRLLLESDETGAKLAIEMFCYRIAKYIGAYFVALGGADRIIFTGGIGENAAPIRDKVMELVKCLGVEPLVIRTNEEVMIARDAVRIVCDTRF
ncbi:MAG: acetate kinase [Chlamydiia bacterium]|nr:acetate kinase [Chlamydiia bacterium]